MRPTHCVIDDGIRAVAVHTHRQRLSPAAVAELVLPTVEHLDQQ